MLTCDARKFGMNIQQQLLWTKSRKWLKLDDSPSSRTEPDFSTISHRPNEDTESKFGKGAQAPFSKYEVSAVLEQKKKITDTDQMEAVDSAQRLLRVQPERNFAVTALFECRESHKSIRWFRVEVTDGGGYFTSASLAPGEMGQRQLLTFLCLSSLEIGLDRPSAVPIDGAVVSVRNWLGCGATSKVYGATWGESMGVVKILQEDFVGYAECEDRTLQRLNRAGVPGIPVCEQIAENALFFDRVPLPVENCSSTKVGQLLECLRAAHEEGIVHRDVRPENVMEEANGRVVLNDWGCSVVEGRKLPFSGTFRYASKEVLDAAATHTDRAPLPKDVLHSLVRTVLALRDEDLRRDLSSIPPGDYTAAKEFWIKWTKDNILHEQFFNAAENLHYDKLRL